MKSIRRTWVGPLAVSLLFIPAALAQEADAQVTATLPAHSRPAPASQPAEVSETTRAAVAQTLDQLAQAVRERNAHDIRSAVDFSRMLDAILESEGGGPVGEGTRSLIQRGLEVAMPPTLLGMGQAWNWTRHEIVRVERAGEGPDVVAWMKGWDDSGVVTRVRWWLMPADESWRVYDWEDVLMPIRASVAMGLSLAEQIHPDGPRRPEWLQYAEDFQAAVSAVDAGDIEGMALRLARIRKAELPPLLSAVRHVLEAGYWAGVERHARALVHLASAERLVPDMPYASLLRAVCCNELEIYDRALESAQRSVRLLGEDAQTCHELGRALAGLGRTQEAIEAHRRGFDDAPAFQDNLIAMARLVGPSGQPQVADALSRTRYPQWTFELVAWRLLMDEQLDSLAAFVDCYREKAPDHPEVLYYWGRSLIHRGQSDEAAASLRKAVDRAADEPKRLHYREWLVEALKLAGRPLEAYREAPNASNGLLSIGNHLLKAEDYGALRQLIDAHRSAIPDDWWIHYYQGRVHDSESDYAAAASEYAQGLEKAQGDHAVELYRYYYTGAAWRAGKWQEAYERVEPREAAFESLARWMSQDAKPDELKQLIELHRDKGSEGRVLLWEAEVEWLRKDYAAAVKLLRKCEPRLGREDNGRGQYEDRMLRSLVRLGRFDEALAVARAATERDGNSWYEMVVHACAGDADALLDLIGTSIDDGYFEARQLYDDEDMGPALQDDAMAAVRERYPKDYEPLGFDY